MAEKVSGEELREFEKHRVNLYQLSQQKQQLQVITSTIDSTIEEINNSDEEKVYKAVGNIMILKDKNKVKEELEKQKESIDLKLKTVESQEKTTMDKMAQIRSKIDSNKKEGGK